MNQGPVKDLSHLAMGYAIFEATPGLGLLLLANAPHFSIVAVSTGWRQYWGDSQPGVKGQDFLAFSAAQVSGAGGDGFNKLQDALAFVVSHKQKQDLDGIAVMLPSGMATAWNITLIPVLDEAGQLAHIICSVADTTTPASQPATRAWYYDLLNAIDQGFCVIDMIFDAAQQPCDYRFVEVNDKFEQHSGLVNALGRRVLELIPNLDAYWFEIYGRVALTGEPVRFQQHSEILDRWFDVYALRLGGAQSRQVAVLFSDISQQKAAEQALLEKDENLRNIVHNAPVAMFIFRGQHMVVDTINALALRMIGRTEVVVGMPLLEVVPELKGTDTYEVFQTVFRTGITQYGLDVLVPLERNGIMEERYFNFTYSPLMENGQVVGVMDVATEVTEQVLARKKIEDVVANRTRELADANAALQNANRELQRSNANLEEFAHAASHDLKEPIRKIGFFTSQLKSQLGPSLSGTELSSFERIENATGRMRQLIDDLLLYSHVSHQPHQKEAVDLNATLHRVLDDLELNISEKNAHISIASLPVVSGYRRQLQQLFQNLLTNALKYSKADLPPHIQITAHEVVAEGKAYHLIAVQDNGIGFAPEYAVKIFQMFTRLHGKAEYGGTGVGLSIAKKVVDNHGGLIRAESAPGEGSVFKVYLPISG